MGVLSLGNFTGIYPRQSKNYLLDNAAQVARNVKLFSGEIRPWMKPVKEYTTMQQKMHTSTIFFRIRTM